MEIFGIDGIGEIHAGDDLAAIIHEASSSSTDTMLSDGDVVVPCRTCRLARGVQPPSGQAAIRLQG
jgi:F420-0:gamma-glutamyl ligase